MTLWNPFDRSGRAGHPGPQTRVGAPCAPARPEPSGAFPPASPEVAAAVLGADGCWCIDVRGLPPPEPLVAILRHVDGQGHDGRPLIVRHEREPALLYAELAQRGWVADRIDGEPGEVRLCLRPDLA